MIRWFIGLSLCLYLNACSPPDKISVYEQEVLQERFEKDIKFSDPARTVLRDQERAKFKGLRYFPVNTNFKFEVPLLPPDSSFSIRMAKQKSEPVEHPCIGYVEIPFSDQTVRLMVFEVDGLPKDVYWIPFNDATNNKETYGGGRYLEVPIKNGIVTIDFNRAYNPYCEYNPDDYNCTIPPRENRISVAIAAGEKKSLLLEPTSH